MARFYYVKERLNGGIMCTAITFGNKEKYFGRNLDLEYRYYEEVTVMPRKFEILYRNGVEVNNHYAIIGMATIVDEYPLYYDGTNEHGLSMAGLNFSGNAWYGESVGEQVNVASFEILIWILGKCKNVKETMEILKKINITNEAFSSEYPPSPLHWIIGDREECIVVEAMKTGLHIYDNKVGVLTNNPPFDYQMINLANYMKVTAREVNNTMLSGIELNKYSGGMGGIGLPGDMSSMSRFVRGAFCKWNSIVPDSEEEAIGQFFHILDNVAQVEGCVRTKDGNERTQYSSCCNVDRGIYYYKTYGNSQINAVNMHNCDLDGSELTRYKIENKENVWYRN